MNTDRIERLLQKYHSEEATEAELDEIESLIAEGKISLDDLQDLSFLQSQVAQMSGPSPSRNLDKRFYEMLSEGRKDTTWRNWFGSLRWPQFAPAMALASLTLLIGLAAGYVLRGNGGARGGNGREQIELLSQQVTDLREMMMLSLLEKGSATERLKAVGLTQGMDEASKKVTGALIQTLNQDENINVRLAALEALKAYAADSAVREELIRAIAQQNSPLVQIALAEFMVAIQERASVTEFEKIIQSQKTPEEVRKKIRESIQTLI